MMVIQKFRISITWNYTGSLFSGVNVIYSVLIANFFITDGIEKTIYS